MTKVYIYAAANLHMVLKIARIKNGGKSKFKNLKKKNFIHNIHYNL